MLEQLRSEEPGLPAAQRRERLVRIERIARTGMSLSKRRRGYYAPALRAAAVAAFLSGERDRASKLFSRSMAHAEKVGAPLQLGETHLELGRCLAEAGDEQQGHRHLETALELFDRAQAQPFAERASALLHRTGHTAAG